MLRKYWGGVGLGWGGDKVLHIERKITSLVHSHPPSHYICKHMFLPTTWILMMFLHYPPFPHIFSWKLISFRCLGILCSSACRSVTFFPFDTHMRKLLGQHMSFFQASWWFLRGAFSLGKRNKIRQGLAASHVNSHWLVSPRHIVPEKTQWKWTWGTWPDSCNVRFLWKKQGMWERSAASHINLAITFNARRVLLEKTHGIWKGFRDARFRWKKIRNPRAVGRVSYEFTGTRNARRILPEKTQGIWGGWYSAHFSLKNTTISPGLASVTCKFTVEIKARRILHEKTQRFLRGRCRWEEGVYINKEQRLITFLALAHMAGATQHHASCILQTWSMLRKYWGGVGLGWGGVGMITFLALAHMVGATQHHVPCILQTWSMASFFQRLNIDANQITQQRANTKDLTVRHCNFFHVQIHCACQCIMTLPPKILWPTALLNTWS